MSKFDRKSNWNVRSQQLNLWDKPNSDVCVSKIRLFVGPLLEQTKLKSLNPEDAIFGSAVTHMKDVVPQRETNHHSGRYRLETFRRHFNPIYGWDRVRERSRNSVPIINLSEYPNYLSNYPMCHEWRWWWFLYAPTQKPIVISTIIIRVKHDYYFNTIIKELLEPSRRRLSGLHLFSKSDLLVQLCFCKTENKIFK